MTMITVKDFDEIVINNPFLTNGITAYGFRNWFWSYLINYNPDALSFPGQSNSTCKYITIKNDFSNETYKVIREDNYVEIQQIFQEKDYDRETVTDTKKLLKVKKKIVELKKIVSRQIDKHLRTINRIENSKVSFDFNSLIDFLNLLLPKLTSSQQEKIIHKFREVEKNPMNYFNDPTNTIGSNPKDIIDAIFFKVLVDELEKFGLLIVVDYKSSFDEVSSLLTNVFDKIGIEFNGKLKRNKNYETEMFLNSANDILQKNNFVAVTFGEVSDTYLIGFINQTSMQTLEKLAKILKIEAKEWGK